MEMSQITSTYAPQDKVSHMAPLGCKACWEMWLLLVPREKGDLDGSGEL